MPRKNSYKKDVDFFDKYYFSKKSAGKEPQKNLGCLDKFYFREYCPFDVQELITEKIIKNRSYRKILEIGCGKGDNVVYLLNKGFNGDVFGIDISSVGIRHAKRKIKNKRANFSVQSASKLNFPADFFDCVYIVNVLHHIDEKQLPKVIEEIERVLKKGGKLLIADLNGLSPLYEIGIKIFSFLPRKLKIFLFKEDLFLNGEFPKRSRVSQKWVKDMLEKSNFKIEYEYYYNLFFNYFYYLYKAGFYYLGKPFCAIFNLLYPFNILLVKMEKSNLLKKIFRYNSDAYIFTSTKK